MKEGESGRRTAVAASGRKRRRNARDDHFAFGNDSYFIVCDLPNAEAGAAIALAVNASGAVSNSTDGREYAGIPPTFLMTIG